MAAKKSKQNKFKPVEKHCEKLYKKLDENDPMVAILYNQRCILFVQKKGSNEHFSQFFFALHRFTKAYAGLVETSEN